MHKFKLFGVESVFYYTSRESYTARRSCRKAQKAERTERRKDGPLEDEQMRREEGQTADEKAQSGRGEHREERAQRAPTRGESTD